MNRSACVLAVVLALAAIACRRDMQTQPKYLPLDGSRFYPDGRASRPIPAGTIAIDEVDQDPAIDTGAVNGAFVTSIPFRVTAELLQRGEDRFNIFCSPCHARTGNGDGMIAQRGFKQPADLNSDRVRNAPPGYLFQVITKGYGAMADYSYQIQSVRDRWAIIAYIRALELSRRANLTDVPPDQRAKLEAQP